MLPFDVARCQGVEFIEDGEPFWREGCEDCLRRTEPGDPAGQWYQAPPAVIVFECPDRITGEQEGCMHA